MLIQKNIKHLLQMRFDLKKNYNLYYPLIEVCKA